MNRPNLNTIVETMTLLDGWEDRYRYILDLARILPPMDPMLKTEESLVRGCTSRVWLVPQIKDGTFHFVADSDAHLVRGLVGILYAAYEGKPCAEVAQLDIEAAFEAMGLSGNLSPNRRNGFFAMVARIRALVQA